MARIVGWFSLGSHASCRQALLTRGGAPMQAVRGLAASGALPDLPLQLTYLERLRASVCGTARAHRWGFILAYRTHFPCCAVRANVCVCVRACGGEHVPPACRARVSEDLVPGDLVDFIERTRGSESLAFDIIVAMLKARAEQMLHRMATKL